MKVANKFRERLCEAQQWLSGQSSDKSLRREDIAPEESLFAAFKRGTAADDSLRRQINVVESVVSRRSEKLSETRGTASNDGRLLAVELLASMYDGLANSISDGFYDESDAPPWDTWIKVVLLGESGYLLCWIPSAFHDQANSGIEVCGGQTFNG